MQVYNSFNTTHNPAFGQIKSIKCTGAYQKQPELAKDLVDTFKANKAAMDFCKKYDVDVVFHSFRDTREWAKSFIIIFFDNPANGKLKKFFNKLLGQKDKVQLIANGRDWNDPIKVATQELKSYILPESAKNSTGVLASHLKLADADISEKLQKQAEILAKNDNEKVREIVRKNQFEKSTDELNAAIKDLIDNSK